MKIRTLGLDIGTASIGWAILDINEKNKKGEIIDSGVRIFPEGVENLGEGENEQTPNAARREHRQKRRQYYRKRLRKNALLKLLHINKMAPTETINSTEFDAFAKLNPYELRKKALSERISLIELGRIFYHMIQRRGFQSNSRSAIANEDSAIYKSKDGKTGISETTDQIKDTTLGAKLFEMLPKDGKPFDASRQRVRNRHTLRKMYIEEFEKIWAVQERFHNTLTPQLKEEIGGRKSERDEKGYQKDGILFKQLPLRSQRHLIGKCTFEPQKRRAHKYSLIAEEFRIWQWINNVSCNQSVLDDSERQMLFEKLMQTEKASFLSLRKVINKADQFYKFNYLDAEKIVGSRVNSKLSKYTFNGVPWSQLADQKKQEIWNILFDYDDIKKLKEVAKTKWGFNDIDQEKIAKFYFPSDYVSLSTKAMRHILPFLEKGYQYDIAVALGGVQKAFGLEWHHLSDNEQEFLINTISDIVRHNPIGGYISHLKDFLKESYQLNDKQCSKLYHHSAQIETNEQLSRLPVSPQADKEIQSIRNPVVTKALFEIRRVVNDLIDRYGKMDRIKIELARDLKKSKTARNEIRIEQRRRERQNDIFKKHLEEHNIPINHENLLRYKLWLECEQTCPFSPQGQNQISFSELFDGSGAVEIEHIMPLSRSLDDSYMNKTLAKRAANQAKGNRTALEYFQSLGIEDEKKNQLIKIFTTSNEFPIRYQKFKRFFTPIKDLDGFISRQLNDTRYISKEAKNYLQKVCSDVRVLSGGGTATMRYLWGLNRIVQQDTPEKSRADHRHHAIDAIVVAATSNLQLTKLSRYYEGIESERHFSPPWKGFRHDVDDTIDQILVSYYNKRKVLTYRNVVTEKAGRKFVNRGMSARGQLHKESVYGKKNIRNETKYVLRKEIESISSSTHVQKVIDPMIRQQMIERLEDLGVNTSGKYQVRKGAFVENGENDQPEYYITLSNNNGDRVPVKKVRIWENFTALNKLKDDVEQYVNPRNNHHILIYETQDGNLKESCVSFWEVIERKKQRQSLYKLPPDGIRIIEVFHSNDLFLLDDEHEIDIKQIEKYSHRQLSKHIFKVQSIGGNESYFEIGFKHHLDARKDKEAKPDYRRIRNFGDGTQGWNKWNPIRIKLSPSGQIVD